MKTPQKKAAADPKVMATAAIIRTRPTASSAIGTRFSTTDFGRVMWGALIEGSLRPGGFGCSIEGAPGGEGIAAAGGAGASALGTDGAVGAAGGVGADTGWGA